MESDETDKLFADMDFDVALKFLKSFDAPCDTIETPSVSCDTVPSDLIKYLPNKHDQDIKVLSLVVPNFKTQNRLQHNNKKYSEKRQQKILKKYGESYAFLLRPTHSLGIKNIPLDLNIPLQRTENKFKDTINKSFHLKHSWLHSTITNSKLRNLKCDLFELIDKFPIIEPSTVAMAWVYFERLILQKVVHKSNRKQYVAACLMLAFKFNEALNNERLPSLIQVIRTLDKKDHLNAQHIFLAEFKLSFDDISSHLLEYFEKNNISFEQMYGVSPENFKKLETIPKTSIMIDMNI